MKSLKLKKTTLILLMVAAWILSVFAVGRFLAGNEKTIGKSESSKIQETQKVVEEESVVIDAVKKVSPSVVSVAVENKIILNPFGFPQTGQKQQEAGIGTGFVVTKDGLILTNKHVVSDQNQKYIAIIKGNDGSERKLDIKKIYRDPFNDLALVQVDANDLKPVEMGDSDKLQVGQKVIAIGNALGYLENTVTTGIISALGRGVNPVDPLTGIAERLEDLLQTDAAINPGNSGGPLLNSAGQVVAINVARSAAGENIGFAIKINIAKQLIDDFQKSGGKISRPFLGIRYTYISRDVAILNEVPEGEWVREIVTGAAAEKAGIKVGDIITNFDGQKLTSEDSLTKIIRSKKVGDSVKVRVFRDGQTLDLTLILGEAPNQ